MRVVLSRDILQFLERENIHYRYSRELAKEYCIASIFDPVERGLYFFTGDQIPKNISNSLVILSIDSSTAIENNNIGLYVDQNPQLLFYRLVSSVYMTASNGGISDTAIIHPQAEIGRNVQIDHFSVVGKAVIGDHAIIRSHCYIHDDSRIGEGVIVENHSVIGAQGVVWVWNEEETEKVVLPQLGGVEIGSKVFLAANTIIVRGSLNENSIVGDNSMMAPGCRIGHGTRIGRFVHFANSIVTGGNAEIGDNCFVGSSAVFRPKVKIHENTVVGAGAVVVKNTTTSGKTLIGVPAIEMETKRHPYGMPKPKSTST